MVNIIRCHLNIYKCHSSAGKKNIKIIQKQNENLHRFTEYQSTWVDPANSNQTTKLGYVTCESQALGEQGSPHLKGMKLEPLEVQTRLSIGGMGLIMKTISWIFVVHIPYMGCIMYPSKIHGRGPIPQALRMLLYFETGPFKDLCKLK